eukprot:713724-Karenia_brevis.AAC.1
MDTRPIDRERAFLEESGVNQQWKWAKCDPPTPGSYVKIIKKRTKFGEHAAPGKDGIPLSAWEAN